MSGDGDRPRFQEGVLAQNETYEYKGAWAFYIRPQLPVSDSLSLSLRAGFGVKYFDYTVDNPLLGMSEQNVILIEREQTEGHIALGAGVEYRFGVKKSTAFA